MVYTALREGIKMEDKELKGGCDEIRNSANYLSRFMGHHFVGNSSFKRTSKKPDYV